MSKHPPAAEGTRWSRTRWIVAASVAVVAAVVLVGVFFWVRKPSLVTAAALDSLLLNAAQINTIIDASDMQMIGEPESGPATPTIALSRPDCLGALSAAQTPTYADSGYTQLRRAAARNTGEHFEHYVAQAVATFPNADKASEFVQQSAIQWRICAMQTVVVMQDANKSVETWKLKTVSGYPPNIALSETREGVNWTCQRAMRAVSNAVIDATACGFTITDQGRLIAEKIAANIST